MLRTSHAHDAIPGFTSVAPSIWEFVPPTSAPVAPELTFGPTGEILEAPSLILLLSWTGAHGRHIVKYTAEYQSLFPQSRILVITTSAKDLCLRSSKRKQERMWPAVDSMLRYDNEKFVQGQDCGRILMHVFSEGGCNKAVELAEAYYNITGARMPVSALCLDSTPGHPRYLRLCNALEKSLPPYPILKHTGIVLGATVLGAIWFIYKVVKGTENNVISQTRRRLMNPVHFDLNAPRCYLYGEKDRLIKWQDVKEHIDEARLHQIPVFETRFQNSGHCMHAKAEPERYWDAVIGTWRCGVDIQLQVQGCQSIYSTTNTATTDEDVGNDDQRLQIRAKSSALWSDARSEKTLCVDIPDAALDWELGAWK